jgi:methyltransferase (TIGR00027 family)
MNAKAPRIADVSDTARWVAYLRALESERVDALFRDPFARLLAGDRGRQIAEAMPDAPGAKPGAAGFASVLAVRTKVFDELILDNVLRCEADAVVNLAAGLDARPYRLELPPSLAWIEADAAAILEPKAALLASEKPRCKLERVAIDLADRAASQALFDRVASSYSRVVVVTEGLLPYLGEGVVRTLGTELRSRASYKRWVLEAMSPASLERSMKAWGHVLRSANAELKFAPASGIEFYRQLGWSPVETRSFFEESRRLDRPVRYASILNLLASASSALGKWLANMVVYGVVEPMTVPTSSEAQR